MPPIDFTQLTALGLLAAAIAFLAWQIGPAIRTLADTNTRTLNRLKASDDVIDKNTEVHKKTADAIDANIRSMDANTLALRSLETEFRSGISSIVATQNNFNVEQTKNADALRKVGDELAGLKRVIEDPQRQPITRDSMKKVLEEAVKEIKNVVKEMVPDFEIETGENRVGELIAALPPPGEVHRNSSISLVPKPNETP